ncbi:MAG: hypothetical protein KAI66_15370 [Lentisphaeria bacterium]|nr:hypothetical protein [Lentisphaeria bacterium]
MDKTQQAKLIGPATADCLPSITLKGNSYERGVQYGKRFGAYLEKFYYWFVKKEPAELLTAEYRAELEKMEALTAQHFPQLLEETKGWSDGAKLEYDKCRIMVFHNEIKSVIPLHCSNVLVTRGGGASPWLARNCDLYENERSWQVQIISHCDDCHSHAGAGYLGLPHSVGVNQAGLAVGGASMSSEMQTPSTGMPNIASFFLWTQKSMAECCDRTRELGHLGKGVNLVLLDASGEGAVLALAGGAHHVHHPGDQGFLIATNHSIDGRFPPPKDFSPEHLENSHARYDRLTEILSEADPKDRDPGLGKKAMADMQGKWSVCEHVPGGFHTIYSWVVWHDQNGVCMDFCWGYPCQSPFESVVLNW